MRLAIAAGTKVFFLPGIPQEVYLTPFGGERVIRGHAGLADGPLDAAGVRNSRTGDVRVDPHSLAVTLDGEPLSIPAAERVAFSDRYLLG